MLRLAGQVIPSPLQYIWHTTALTGHWNIITFHFMSVIFRWTALVPSLSLLFALLPGLPAGPASCSHKRQLKAQHSLCSTYYGFNEEIPQLQRASCSTESLQLLLDLYLQKQPQLHSTQGNFFPWKEQSGITWSMSFPTYRVPLTIRSPLQVYGKGILVNIYFLPTET